MERPAFDIPERENLATPKVASDVIESELRTGGSGTMLRENILYGLGAIYDNTRLAGSLQEYASMIDISRQYDAFRRKQTFIPMADARTQAFYAGSLLALHAEMSLEKPAQRRHMLSHTASERVPHSETPHQTERRRVAELLEYTHHHFNWFGEYSKDLQISIATAASRAYESDDHFVAVACQTELVFGCTFTFKVIEQMRKRIGQ